MTEAAVERALRFEVKPWGLQVSGDPTFEEWLAFGHTLHGLRRAVQFAIGDWINYGERRWGEKYAQALDETRYNIDTLRNYASVAAAVDISRRRDDLPFTYHQAVAPLPPAAQDRLLDQAAALGWDRETIRQKALDAQGLPVTKRERFDAELLPDGSLSVAHMARIRSLQSRREFAISVTVSYVEDPHGRD